MSSIESIAHPEVFERKTFKKSLFAKKCDTDIIKRYGFPLDKLIELIILRPCDTYIKKNEVQGRQKVVHQKRD